LTEFGPLDGKGIFFQISDFRFLQMVWGLAFGLVLWSFTL
jgi:hypothetical protein